MLLTHNEILRQRTEKVGVLPKDLAINAGVTGPLLRASGVDYDLRKVDGYSIYPRFSFKVPLGTVGDVYDRYYVRILEMRESVKILQQALKGLPKGPAISPKGAALVTAPRTFRPPKGDAYGRIEAPKGELGFYLVSDGSHQPYRYHVRAPSFINLTILEDMCLGHKVADAIIILGSIDIVLGEVDRGWTPSSSRF
jgi:NADH-quinone oxidoreductase subunit D